MSKSRWKLFIKDEQGAFGGFIPDLITGLIAAYGLSIMVGVFVTLLKAFAASVVLINFGHAYSLNQYGIDPNTGTPYAQEAAAAFSNILPVSNSTSDVASIPPSIGQATQPGQLILYIGADPSNGGFDELTVDYALQLPISIPTWNGSAWTSMSPQPIQLYFNLDFYQEW